MRATFSSLYSENWVEIINVTIILWGKSLSFLQKSVKKKKKRILETLFTSFKSLPLKWLRQCVRKGGVQIEKQPRTGWKHQFFLLSSVKFLSLCKETRFFTKYITLILDLLLRSFWKHTKFGNPEPVPLMLCQNLTLVCGRHGCWSGIGRN